MAGRPVDDFLPLAQSQEIRDRDRFIMGDEPSVLRLGGRRPGAHPGARARTQQIDRAIRPKSVALSFQRQMFFMGSPSEFGGLQSFRNKTLDRPSVDENAARFRRR